MRRAWLAAVLPTLVILLAPSHEAHADEAPATVRAPRAKSLPRLWRTFRIRRPTRDVTSQASLQASAPALLGRSFEQFALEQPGIARRPLWRILETGAGYGFLIPWWVLSHEYGHALAAEAFGGDPDIQITGFGRGVTFGGFSRPLTTDERLAFSAGGMNQSQHNQIHMFRDWALSGALRPIEAGAFLVNRLDTSWYSWRVDKETPALPTSRDPREYARLMRIKGVDIDVEDLRAMGLAMDLLSASSWAALLGQLQFLVEGTRLIRVPTLRVGRTWVTYPNFHLLLGTEGPVLGGTVFVNPLSRFPLEVRTDVRHDRRAFAVTAAVHGVRLPTAPSLRFSPLLRLVRNAQGGVGYAAGGSVSVEHQDGLRMGLELIHHKRDFVRDIERFGAGRGDGLEISFLLGVGL